jgi:branched-chain amino acid aminotransferase
MRGSMASAGVPVTQVDGRPLGNGAPGLLTTELRTQYWQKREAGWLGTPVAALADDDGLGSSASV